MQETKWYTSGRDPSIVFEDTKVGRMKKIWDASEEEIDAILSEYEIPPFRIRNARMLYPEYAPMPAD